MPNLEEDWFFENIQQALRKQQNGEIEEAITHYERAAVLGDKVPALWNNLGNLYRRQRRFAEAEKCFEKAASMTPDDSDLFYNWGLVEEDQGKFDSAILHYEKAIELNSEHIDALCNLGSLLSRKRRFAEAEKLLERTISLQPAIDAYLVLAGIHQAQGRLQMAKELNEKVLSIDKNCDRAYSNLGSIYQASDDVESAIDFQRKAIAIDDKNADSRVNLALALLLKGRFEEGFAEYEWRWKQKREPYPFDEKSLWNGELEGNKTKVLLLVSEQGYGDTIQFIRLVEKLKPHFKKVILQTQLPLATMLDKRYAALSEVIVKGRKLPHFDVHLPLMSLPHVLKLKLGDVVNQEPYLKLTSKRKKPIEGFHVGIVWQGNPEHTNDINRSCPLELWGKVLNVPGVSFTALQFGFGIEQIEKLDLKKIKVPKIESFEDTAKEIEKLNLVITIDTAIAHLAGAMGKPVWLLVPFAPDWRWLLKRQDSPWYSSMRIFRQPKSGDWQYVLNYVSSELATYVNQNKTG